MSQSRTFTRRRLLKGAAQTASLSVALSLMPPNVRKLMAQSAPRRGSLKDIKHVVLLMQENRSFDHYFGTMSGVRGFGDPGALVLPDGQSVFHQPDSENPSGYTLPFHLDSLSTSAQWIPSTGHGWAVQHAAWNGGRMDRWLPAHREADGAHGPYTMGYFKREDIPFHRALAEAFTICDAYHCSVLGPTRPNRFHWLTGTANGDGRFDFAANQFPSDGLTWKTYPERLEEAGISWKAYRDGDQSLGLNILRMFRQFMDAPPGSPLRVKGMPAASDGEFEYEALHDRLPTVSWLHANLEACEHPAHGSPAAGAEFIAGKLDAIAANPDVWAKTVFILNYDENDGLFDHVPPPVPPEGTDAEFADGLPIGAGFRVPCIIVSPWTAGGWVCSQPFDHTSILRLLERITGVTEPNISSWRRRTFGDMTAAFRFDTAPAAAPVLPETGENLKRARFAQKNLPAPPIPGTDQTIPVQEKGEREHTSFVNVDVEQ